jgi:hypothetical protein
VADKNQNGNYVKVIDNNGDGVADYILKTEYTMDVITNIDARGTYTLAGTYNATTNTTKTVTVNADKMVSEDELASGDVIVYALIDGVCYANLAEVVTDTIDVKGINFKTGVITCGDNTYTQSGIAIDEDPAVNTLGAFNNAFTYDSFLFDVTDATTKVPYDLYLDNYGFVRAYTANKYTNGLGLLTDAYYYTNKRTAEGQVTMVTADTEAADYDVANVKYSDTEKTTANGFIDITEETSASGNRGTWKRLKAFQDTTTGAYTGFQTNVAAYTEADGTVSLYDPTTNLTNTTGTKVIKSEITVAAASTLSSRDFKTLAGDTVRTTTDTVYYYVTKDAKGDLAVKTWTGYANAPKNLSLVAGTDHAYTVATGTRTVASNNALYYYYANVVVIEASSSLSDIYFGYYSNTKNGTSDSFWLDAVGPYTNDDDQEVYGTTTKLVNKPGTLQAAPAFYTITGQSIAPISSNYNKNGIYASTVVLGKDVYDRDYVKLADGTEFYTSDVTVYAVSETGEKNVYLNYAVSETTVSVGDDVIYVKDGRNVVYAINVTKSVDAHKVPLTVLTNTDKDGLYDLIVAEQNKVDDTIPTLTDLTVKGTDVAIGPDNKGSIELSATAAADLTTDHLAFTVSPADTTSVVVYAGSTAVTMDAVNTTTGAVAPTSDKKAITAAETLTIVLVNGTKSKTYTVDVTVAAKKQVATIDTLKVKGVAATPDPDHADTFNVTVTPAKNAGSDPQVEVTTTDVNAKVTTLTNGTNTPLSATNIALGDKASTATGKMAAATGTFKIEVTAEDGTTKKEYTVNVTVSAPVVTYTNADGQATNSNATNTLGGSYGAYTYTATITPKQGYVLKSVTVNGGSNKVVDADTQKSVTLSENITADTTIVVVTEAITYKVEFTVLTTSNQTIVVSSNDLSKTDAVTFDLYNTTSGTDVRIGVTDSSASLAAGTHSYTPGASLNSGDTIKAVATINGVPYTATAIVP